VLVIGYGNDLRRDDGAGRLVADEIERRDLPGIEVRSVPQLTPELALDLAGRDRVVFVDASVDADRVTVTPVSAADPGSGIMSHHGDPASLLALTATVGEVPAEAWIVCIPASDLGLGSDLSTRTRHGVEEAVDRVADLVRFPSPRRR
jgi:hydrogenase maturation protease